jgi:galactitol-specific phosphotransferase system IIC component
MTVFMFVIVIVLMVCFHVVWWQAFLVALLVQAIAYVGGARF